MIVEMPSIGTVSGSRLEFRRIGGIIRASSPRRNRWRDLES